MPKFFSRVDFETMKVLRKRGGSIKDISKAVGRSVDAVRRNLNYNSYEDYLAAMYRRRTKYQKEIEEKSGPVKVIVPASKKCSCCGQVKPVSAFTPDKWTADGYKGQCRECINAKVRERRKRRNAAKETAHVAVHVAKQPEPKTEPKTPDLATWEFIADELKKMIPPQKVEEPIEEPTPIETPVEEVPEQGLEPRVGEVLHAFVDHRVRRVEIVGSREVSEFGYTEKRYLVKYKSWFKYKYADISEQVLYED